jgi:hypothetical protein
MAIQLTKKGWSNSESGTWSKRSDKVKASQRGIIQSSRARSFTLAGDDVINGTAKNVSGINISGSLNTQAGNDAILGNSTSQAGIYNEGWIDTGRENDRIQATSSTSRGLENQGDIYTEDGDDLITGMSDQEEGISNSGFISMGGGNDTLTGSGSIAGLRNDNYISMGKGSDIVNVFNGGFSGDGYLDMGPGFDTVIGFGPQTVDGGGDRDSLLLAKGRYSIAANSDPWGNPFGKAITDKGGTTMVAANIESIGSALSREQVTLTDGTLLINAMGEVSYL